MSRRVLHPFPWQEPWDALPESLQVPYQAQLKHEVGHGHPLFGYSYTPVGKHAGTDDVLVALEGGQLAVVHLTWGGLGDKYHPRTTFFASWDDFAVQRMDEDALDYF